MKRKKYIRIIKVLVLVCCLGIIKQVLFPSNLSSKQAWKKWSKITKIEEFEQLVLWNEDIDYLIKFLEKRHKNLYHSISKEELLQDIQKLRQDLNNLSDIGKLVNIKSLVAKIGDGHTRVANDIPMNWFPFGLQKFDDGAYVIYCPKEFEQILGYKLTAINGKDIDEISSIMSEMISHDNDINLLDRVLFIIRNADYLEYYDIIENNESASFHFESHQGEKVVVEMESYFHKNVPTEWVDIREKYVDIENVLYTVNNDEIYWYKFFEDESLVYFQYNRCQENKSNPLDEFIPELLSVLEDNNVEKFVFDLRSNGGGNSSLIEPLINSLASNDKINQTGNLYVVIGNDTYSSAVLNTIKLTQQTNAILIGQPTGGMPNHYGEVKNFNLPNSGLSVSYSTKYFQHSDNYDGSIYPDIDVVYAFGDFINGIDPVMIEIIQ